MIASRELLHAWTFIYRIGWRNRARFPNHDYKQSWNLQCLTCYYQRGSAPPPPPPPCTHTLHVSQPPRRPRIRTRRAALRVPRRGRGDRAARIIRAGRRRLPVRQVGDYRTAPRPAAPNAHTPPGREARAADRILMPPRVSRP